MAKTFTEDANTTAQDESKKQRKKLAKRAAKLQLRLEEAQKALHQAEQKLAKAHANLDANKTLVRDLEEKLAQLHTPAESQNDEHAAEQSNDQADATETVTSLSADDLAAIFDSTAYELDAVVNIVDPTTLPPLENHREVTSDAEAHAAQENQANEEKPQEVGPATDQTASLNTEEQSTDSSTETASSAQNDDDSQHTESNNTTNEAPTTRRKQTRKRSDQQNQDH